MKLRIHAICLALNEEPFICELLRSLYPFCSGISIISQYDRDYYRKPVKPDQTIPLALNFHDPEGKIHLVCRRYRDETTARNHEMQAICAQPQRGILTHGVPMKEIEKYHEQPDYFLIVDADEIYDVDTLAGIIDHLAEKRPRGMRVTGHQYLWTWNQRIPTKAVHHHHFGFVRAGMLFEMRRTFSFNEHRLQKFLRMVHLPDFSAALYGFIDCPIEVGVFHHGSYLGGAKRVVDKFAKHSHPEANCPEYIASIGALPYDLIPTMKLPRNIREGDWPAKFFDEAPAQPRRQSISSTPH